VAVNEKTPQPDKAPSPSGEGQWILHAIGGVREDIGKLEDRLREDIGKLEGRFREDIGKLENRLFRLQITVWLAVGGITAVLGLVGWVFRPIIAVIAEKMLTAG